MLELSIPFKEAAESNASLIPEYILSEILFKKPLLTFDVSETIWIVFNSLSEKSKSSLFNSVPFWVILITFLFVALETKTSSNVNVSVSLLARVIMNLIFLASPNKLFFIKESTKDHLNTNSIFL